MALLVVVTSLLEHDGQRWMRGCGSRSASARMTRLHRVRTVSHIRFMDNLANAAGGPTVPPRVQPDGGESDEQRGEGGER